MPQPATARPVTQLGEAAVANASDGQSGKELREKFCSRVYAKGGAKLGMAWPGIVQKSS